MSASPCDLTNRCDCGATGCPELCATIKPANIYVGYEIQHEPEHKPEKPMNRHERRAAAKRLKL